MNKTRTALAILAMSATMSAAQPASTPAAAPPSEVQPLLGALAVIGGIIANADKTEAAECAALAEKAEGATATPGSDPAAAPKPRSTRNSVTLVTSGAAAGAALGAAMGKGSKAAMIGAAVGGAVGLIYDRMTYKNPGKI